MTKFDMLSCGAFLCRGKLFRGRGKLSYDNLRYSLGGAGGGGGGGLAGGGGYMHGYTPTPGYVLYHVQL